MPLVRMSNAQPPFIPTPESIMETARQALLPCRFASFCVNTGCRPCEARRVIGNEQMARVAIALVRRMERSVSKLMLDEGEVSMTEMMTSPLNLNEPDECLMCTREALPNSEELPLCREHADFVIATVDEIDGPTPAPGWRSCRARCRVCDHRQISVFPVTADDSALECGKCHSMTAEVE